jgi:hypothetical protein
MGEFQMNKNDTGIRYCGLYLPRTIPAGRDLVHKHVGPVNRNAKLANRNHIGMLGLNGFRAWTQNTQENLVECNCDFGGCKNAELH